MSFLFPGAFVLGALAAVIVALYLQRPRRRALEVSTLLFWRRILEREPRRRFLGRLRAPYSLFLQLLIFLLVLLALARPDQAWLRGRHSTVIVLDARARMQAPGVFGDAVLAAHDIVSRLGPKDEAAILGVEGETQIISAFSNDSRELRRKLAALSPSDAGGDLQAALLLARRLLDAKPGGHRLVVISDRPVPASEGVEQITVGKPRENIAILGLAERPVPASPQSAELFAKLGNLSFKARDVELELSLDGRPFDVQRFQIGAGDYRSFSTLVPREMLASGSGFLEARLTSEDGLGFDNTARAALPTGQRLRILLVGSDDPFLENALKADPALEVEILRPEAWRTGLGENFDVVVFDDWLPDGTTLDSLNRGCYFFFGRAPWNAGGVEVPTALLEAGDRQSPLLWNVDLTEIRLAKATRLDLPKDGLWRVSIPVKTAEEPMIAALEGPRGLRAVVTAFKVADSNFPLRVGFPLFVSNVIHWLARRDLENSAWKAGQTFIPGNGEEISKGPIKEAEASRAGERSLFTGKPLILRENGFYEVRGPVRPKWLAVNTSDPAESDLRAADSGGKVSALQGTWWPLQPWRWLALAAALLLAVEWGLYHRRVTE